VLADRYPTGGAIGETQDFTDTAPSEGVGYYRVIALMPSAPDGFVLIPGGTFTMGDDFQNPAANRTPHDVTLGTFLLQARETTKAQWDEVWAWARDHGYIFDNYLPTGSVSHTTGDGKAGAPDHPVVGISWYDAVKWCNARSQKEGLRPCYYADVGFNNVFTSGQIDLSNNLVDWRADGYRLPTEAEWERAARGGLEGKLFPWGDTITHAQANYFSSVERDYDISPTRGYHPAYWRDRAPFTAPVASFSPNAFGLFDMAGNVFEWCWDVYETDYYLISPRENPLGPDSGTFRVNRGGSWNVVHGGWTRVAVRNWDFPYNTMADRGFRVAKNL
jgi:formylglycine-generating enzyme required for sulfatase activity